MSSPGTHTVPRQSSADPATLLKQWWPALLVATGLLLSGWIHLRDYLQPELNVWLALLSLPFVLYVRDPARRPLRYGILALVMIALFPLLQIRITFHLALCFSLLFLLESAVGRLNAMPAALLLVLSPLPHYFASVLGFPLRLWLSEAAGRVFRLMGMEVEVRGNLFVQDGVEFAVDPACTGIQLFVTGLVVFVILLSYFEKRQQRRFPFGLQIGFLALGMGLVLLANLMRIILLVLLRSEPETASHDAVGMACLVFYFVLPMALVMGRILRKWGRPQVHSTGFQWTPPARNRTLWGLALAGGLLAAGQWGGRAPDIQQHLRLESLELGGYLTCITDDGVLALENEHALVYLKPPVPFYGADHYPEICWRAGGFKVRGAEKVLIAGQEMIRARLETDALRYHTVWWYDNGPVQTTSAFRWRTGQLKGEPGYFLVNITVADPGDLDCAVREWKEKEVMEVLGGG